MSVDEETVKTGSPRASSASPLQLSDYTGGYTTISAIEEGTVATPNFVAACPIPDSAASPKHTSTTDALTHSEVAAQRAKSNENNIQRRNIFHHSKQQQQSRVTKRRYTSSFSFKHPTSGKRRRRANSESDSVLPTNFLLGGNIFDPLNLNSLLDEEVNKALNAETPKSSPLPAKSRDPVEILIPRDITDPLNLNSGIADKSFLISPYRSGGKKRHRNRHHGGSNCGNNSGTNISASQLILPESGRNGAKPGSCAPLDDTLASSSAQNVSQEAEGSRVDSHEHLADSSVSCKEDVSIEELSSSVTGGTSQHTSRRKRRRNSGKVDPPITHSTPVGKPVRNGGTGASQSFHTPRSGPRSGQGGRPHQHSQGKDQRKKFQYGNYNKYYGYRNPGSSEDPRTRFLKPEWFKGKNVLDLGCNSGHLTLYIAKMLQPAHILGLDIDSHLVHVARNNIRHYLSELQTEDARQTSITKPETHTTSENQHRETARKDKTGEMVKGESGPVKAVKDNDCVTDEPPAGQSVSSSFPVSLRISRGPIAAPPLSEVTTAQPGQFPSNVSFIKANYVLDSDNLLLTQRPEYDVVLCLSVTKWVHLNWGDPGLKRLFKRVYRHLRPGGLFILEPQPWESYSRRKKITDNMYRNYNNIHLKPDQFTSYLTSEVGFTSYEYLGAPKSSVGGFQRPIYLFHK